MSKLRDFGIAADGQRHLFFHCPGCKHGHSYTVPRWTWNGSMDKPTFTPSLLNTTPEKRCHLFVTDGRIHFCSDCRHELAGQTVEMEDEDDVGTSANGATEQESDQQKAKGSL